MASHLPVAENNHPVPNFNLAAEVLSGPGPECAALPESAATVSRLMDDRGVVHTVSTYADLSLHSPFTSHLIARELLPLCIAGFMHGAERLEDRAAKALYEDLLAHIESAERLVLCTSGGELRAFSLAAVKRFRAKNLYHAIGMVVNPPDQGAGIGRAILSVELENTHAELLAFHTQTKLSCRLAARFATYSRELALDVAAMLGTRCRDGDVERSRYGDACLYGDTQKFADFAISSIDWQKGDALIWAGYIKNR